MKIKVLVDAHIFDSSFQGTSTYIRGLYSALVEDPEFEITLAAKNTQRLRTLFPDQRFKFVELPSESKIKRLGVDLPALIREHKFDFAHFQYIIPLKKECKYINTIHDLLFMDFPSYFPWTYRFTKFFTFGLSAKRADVLCTVSEYSKRAIQKHFRISAEKIIITPNAVDPFRGNLVDIKTKHKLDKYILYVSRFEPRKNHYTLLKAFIELGLYNQGYKLVFIGRFKDVENPKYTIYFNGLSQDQKEAVLYFENLPDQELYSFYKYTDLFIYPSLAEGFGIPPLEAAIMECKVLCSNQTALTDFSFFGEYFFNPNDIEELKRKIQSVLIAENYPYSTIRSAAIENYNWKRISVQFAEVLKNRLT